MIHPINMVEVMNQTETRRMRQNRAFFYHYQSSQTSLGARNRKACVGICANVTFVLWPLFSAASAAPTSIDFLIENTDAALGFRCDQ